MIYWIIGKFYAKISRHKKTYQEIKKLSAFKPFRDRRTDSVAYRGTICNQKGCPKIHRIIGKLYAKI